MVESDKGILSRTKLALLLKTMVASRPRRQGSAMNGSTKSVEPPLTPLPAREGRGVRKKLLKTPTTLYMGTEILRCEICANQS